MENRSLSFQGSSGQLLFALCSCRERTRAVNEQFLPEHSQDRFTDLVDLLTLRPLYLSAAVRLTCDAPWLYRKRLNTKRRARKPAKVTAAGTKTLLPVFTEKSAITRCNVILASSNDWQTVVVGWTSVVQLAFTVTTTLKFQRTKEFRQNLLGLTLSLNGTLAFWAKKVCDCWH